MQIAIVVLVLVILILLICNLKAPPKMMISPDPFRAAFMEMAAARNDPLSNYLYSFN